MLPIGVFDSGVGGLTVLRALRRQLPWASFMYLGDTARVPYGTKSIDTVIRYAHNVTHAFLEKQELSMLVVACNTATAAALPSLQSHFSIPVVGVIEPGAHAALVDVGRIDANKGILVVGTAGTVRSRAYEKTLRQLGYEGKIFQQACPLLVPLVEEGWLTGEVPQKILKRYVEPYLDECHTVILGCTHYPLLMDTFQQVFGAQVHITDSARATAEVVYKMCQKNSSDLEDTPTLISKENIHYWVSDGVESFLQLAPQFMGESVLTHQVELIDVYDRGPIK